MKILMVSNLYPPSYMGGYELRCSQVAEYLLAAGHEVRILTSFTRLPVERDCKENLTGSRESIPVERSLRYHTFHPCSTRPFRIIALAKAQLAEARRFNQLLDTFQPDIVNWWNLEGITKTILALPALRGVPDVFCAEDTWMIREYGVWGENESLSWFDFWKGSWNRWLPQRPVYLALTPWRRRIRREGIPTFPFANAPRHVCFVSEFMCFEHSRAGLALPSSEVIYGGVPPERFFARRTTTDFENRRLRLLYAGYVEPNRGLHTIVEALGLLPQDLRESVELSITQTDPPTPPEPGGYVDEIKKRIKRLGLSKTVHFLGRIRHDEMPAIYKAHHVLVSATTRQEGFPMTMLEAMCAGCAVITTGSGGAYEIADAADLPIFPKDHPPALSRLIEKLVRDRDTVFSIAMRGQDVTLREFTFKSMGERICRAFENLVENNKHRAEASTQVAAEQVDEAR